VQAQDFSGSKADLGQVLQGAQSRHPSKDRADIQFSIAHEKAVIRIPGVIF
jgi:hypothetical protein